MVNAAEKRKQHVVILPRWKNVICDELTKEEAGQIIKAAYRYVSDGTEPDFNDNRALKMFWQDVKDTQDFYNNRH